MLTRFLLGQHLAGYPLAVDERPVVAAEVDDLVAAGGRLAQFRVVPRHVEVGQDQVVVGYPADAHGLGRQRHPGGGPAVHARQQLGLDRRGRRGRRGRLPAGGLGRDGGRHRRGGPGRHRGLGRLIVAGRGSRAVTRGVVARGGLGGRGWGGGRSGRHRQRGTRVIGRGGGGRRGRGRSHLGHAAQDRAVVRVAQPHHAFLADLDPVEPLQSEKRSVGAAEIFYDPRVTFNPHRPVPPRHARIGHDDVGLRVPADTVRGPGRQLMDRAPGPYFQVGRGRRARDPARGRGGFGYPGGREPGWGRTGLRRATVRPVKTLGWHVYKV